MAWLKRILLIYKYIFYVFICIYMYDETTEISSIWKLFPV